MSRRVLEKLRAIFQLNPGSLLSGGLLGLLLFFYLASVYILVTALSTFPFGEQPNENLLPDGRDWGLYIIIMAVIAITFVPVSRWLNDRVNDLVYAQDDNSLELVASINRLLAAMDNPELTLPIVVKTIAEHMRLDYVCLEFGPGDEPKRFSYGSLPAVAQPLVYPVTYLDRPVGRLMAAGRVGKRSLSHEDRARFDNIAPQLGIALHVARLTADLQGSRERLVTTREEERRRIRNDLHDGLAPTVRNFLGDDSAQAKEIINELSRDLRQAMGDIRSLVYDLRPPLLDEMGLVGAIQSLDLAESPIRLAVRAPEPMPSLSAAVEVAVFRITKEALQNARLHGEANTCEVSILVESGQLELTIIDDGRGLSAGFTAGIGLASMNERAAELGGTFVIEALQGAGTRIKVNLPLGKE
jgi:signal transduction histidine kinase